MDHVVVEYLRSGRAWVLVGSGPSNAMGYPSWGTLAGEAIRLVRETLTTADVSRLLAAHAGRSYAAVFEEAARLVGPQPLLQGLRRVLRPSQPTFTDAYDLIVRWPVSVYLTTNYDDELNDALVRLREPFITIRNTPDDMAELVPDASRIIAKVHGDLRSPDGLILRASDYAAISGGVEWEHWRTKMTSIFQMQRVIVVGHSLQDENVRHVLDAAAKGAKVNQPVCWIAPDVSDDTIREYSARFRIHILSYDNTDGTHRNLLPLLRKVTDFVPDRTAVRIRRDVEDVTRPSPNAAAAAAAGFLIFNAAAAQDDFDARRVAVITEAARAAIATGTADPVSLEELLHASGWPPHEPVAEVTRQSVTEALVREGAVVRAGDKLHILRRVTGTSRQQFDDARRAYLRSIELRVRREFPQVSEGDARRVAEDLERSLVGFFREGGLTLATLLFQDRVVRSLPASILRFIKDASAQYDTHLMRQAFITVAIDSFVRAERPERIFLGKVSRGFFDFHALGTFGEAARERLGAARETVWLIDSDTQIPALAVGHPTHAAARDTFARLRDGGVRLFTTEKLFDETFTHVWFAQNLVRRHGDESMMVAASATGEAPFQKTNAFLQGFVVSRAAGQTTSFRSYMHLLFGANDVEPEHVRRAVERLGIEIADFSIWPGFDAPDFEVRDQYTAQIANIDGRMTANDIPEDRLRKAAPEAEALVIVERERTGAYRMLAAESSTAWFITHTSVLNRIGDTSRRTWRPEAFFNFAATLSPKPDGGEDAFERLLWNLAESGVSVVGDDVIATAFGHVIDQSELQLRSLRESYEETLRVKYAAPLDEVIDSIARPDRPDAAIQLATEIAAAEKRRREAAEARERVQIARAEAAESQLKGLKHLAKKLAIKQADAPGRLRKLRAKRQRKQRKGRSKK